MTESTHDWVSRILDDANLNEGQQRIFGGSVRIEPDRVRVTVITRTVAHWRLRRWLRRLR